MNHGPLVRAANGRVPSAVDAGGGIAIAKPVEMMSEMEQLKEPAPLVPHSGRVAIPPVNGLLHKAVDHGTRAAVPFYK